jgi:hypothetical protein
MRQTTVLAALCLAILATPSGAAHYHVSPDGLGDYATIQAAVDSAAAGDTVKLANGVFTGDGNRDIDFGGKDLVVRSESGSALTCEIDCEASLSDPHRGFNFHSGETRASQVLDITIRSGYAYDEAVERNGGGGFRIDGASPTIRNCYVLSCAASGGTTMGGGVSIVNGANPLLDTCGIDYCNAEGYGGGIGIFEADATITACTIAGNTCTAAGGGLYVQDAFNSEVRYCWFFMNIANDGGGLRIGGCDLTPEGCLIEQNEATDLLGRESRGGGALLSGGGLLDCTVVGNSTNGVGGGVLCLYADDVTLTNCIIAGNTDGSGVACYVPADAMTLVCCDVWGNAEGDYGANMTDQTGVSGNISGDPLFCNVPVSDYTIDAASPCAPANNTCGVYMGSSIVNCDSPVESSSWGAVKALFRR